MAFKPFGKPPGGNGKMPAKKAPPAKTGKGMPMKKPGY